jgi:hypothetical protein
MGNGVGVHSEDEVKNLTKEQRDQLKDEVIRHLRTSEEIHQILRSDPNIIETLTKSNTQLRDILKKGCSPTYSGFQKK